MDRSSRRLLYRRGKRMLLGLLARRWRGPRRTLEPAVRRFLGPLSRPDLSSLLADHHVAMAAVVALLAVVALPTTALNRLRLRKAAMFVASEPIRWNSFSMVGVARRVRWPGATCDPS